LGLSQEALDALLARRELAFSTGATRGNTYTGKDRQLWLANKEQLWDDLVSDKGAAGVLELVAAVSPDWFNTAGGELVTGLADWGGLNLSVATKDRQPIPVNERRLATLGFVTVVIAIMCTIGLASPLGWVWQSSYFGWRSGANDEPRAAAVLGAIGLVPIMFLVAFFLFGLVLVPLASLADNLIVALIAIAVVLVGAGLLFIRRHRVSAA
jgi:hypothetical protein